ncbi:hypothetical protein BAE44_0017455 [Dichanthelium oligosanthes]|uniref:Uncharacterized protein n=1 Tax=Dichanthelium oligosanthes TaxID=888268 RepID=A0A1E5V945_9POAL|nr:hypothetical protein BAE44_0017455 [Dichanthelium oligosanthes]
MSDWHWVPPAPGRRPWSSAFSSSSPRACSSRFTPSIAAGMLVAPRRPPLAPLRWRRLLRGPVASALRAGGAAHRSRARRGAQAPGPARPRRRRRGRPRHRPRPPRRRAAHPHGPRPRPPGLPSSRAARPRCCPRPAACLLARAARARARARAAPPPRISAPAGMASPTVASLRF